MRPLVAFALSGGKDARARLMLPNLAAIFFKKFFE